MSRQWLVIRTSFPAVSFRVDRRVPLVLLLLSLATLAGVILNLGMGEYSVLPLDVLRTLLHMDTGDPQHAFIVNSLRLPRVLVACAVGLALGISGAIMQGVTRNSLASPEITGVTAGASFAAVTLIVLVPTVSVSWVPVGALVGAGLVAAAIYVLAWRGGDSPLRFVLVGIGLTSVLSALTSLMVTFGNIDQVSQAMVWLAGSLNGRTWEDLRAILPWLLLLPAVQLMASRMDLLMLGEDVAKGLGSKVELDRGLLVFMSAALAAASVAVAGTVGFVGLMAPHVARRLVGNSHQGLLPVAGVSGALIMVLSDLLGRTVFAPTELPVGVVTAAVGAPFLMYLLYRGTKEGSVL